MDHQSIEEFKAKLEKENGGKLEALMAMQNQLNQYIIARRSIEGLTMSQWLQNYTMAAYVELGELLDETNYKWWKNPKELDLDKIKGEIVDVIHFVLSLCLAAGMDAQEVYDRYMRKNKVNFDRQVSDTAYNVQREGAGV